MMKDFVLAGTLVEEVSFGCACSLFINEFSILSGERGGGGGGGIRTVSGIIKSASYRFLVAELPKIATAGRMHCPKRP